jgi:hypothetical protein
MAERRQGSRGGLVKEFFFSKQGNARILMEILSLLIKHISTGMFANFLYLSILD